MRYLHYFIFAFLIASCSEESNTTVIKGVNVFDGEDFLENVNLVFQDDKIIKISKGAVSFNAKIIDGDGKTIIPPLLNAHVHSRTRKDLKDAINFGVFALLDMHNTDRVATTLRQFRDSIGYAYYYSSGPGVTVQDGHGTQFGITVPTINDSYSPSQFVNDRVEKGADYIKILREPLMPTINYQQTEEIIITAHNYSKLCVSHITFLTDAMRLAGQGIDGFVHIWWDKGISEPQLDSLLDNDLFIIPTLKVIERTLELGKQQGWASHYLTFNRVLEQTKKAYKKGIPILAGTDCPNFNLNCNSDIFREMQLLARAGLNNIDILKAATSNVYNSFHLEEFGILEQGKSASFTLINGNPIDQLEDIANIEGIWQKGIRIK